MDINPTILQKKLRLAGLVLGCETFFRLIWPLQAWVTLFVALALTDLLPRLAPLWHGALLSLFGLGALLGLSRLRHFRRPSLEQCQRRLERDSGLDHRPLSQLEDRPAGAPDADGFGLWQLNRQRLMRLLAGLRLAPPQPGLPALDPYGLRFGALLLLAIGLAAGRHDVGDRLDRAFDPGWRDDVAPLAVQVWITPPAYTGLSPLMLRTDQTDQDIAVPAGSKLLAELQGSEQKARLLIDRQSQDFEQLDRLGQKLETELNQGRRLTIRLGRHLLASWPIHVIADQPPEVAFAEPPAPLPMAKLQLRIKASDDYGVTALGLTLRRIGAEAGEDEDDITLPGGGEKKIVSDLALDLGAHRWSGLKVEIRPTASDAAGHRTFGNAVSLTLPEREFRHPVARAVAALRRQLAADPRRRPETFEQLSQILAQPSAFHDDTIAFLQMVTARSRLARDRSSSAIASVLDMLWAAALHIEDGDLHDARDAVDQASQALQQALDQGASDQEISRLTAELNDAMHRLIASLAKQRGKNAPSSSGGGGSAMTEDQLQAMLNQLSDLAHSGAKQAAQQSLRNLQSLLDQLSAGGDDGAMMQQWQQGMNALQGVTEGEKSLLDQSYREGGDPARQRKTQEGLRQQLEGLMKHLPQPGAAPALDQAIAAMKQAEQSLQSGQGQQALESEGQALARLQQGARQIAEVMAQSGGGGGATDPLGRGRPDGQSSDDGKVKIPSQSDLGKSREILDELRRRAGQAERPAAERSYLRRLLEKLY